MPPSRSKFFQFHAVFRKVGIPTFWVGSPPLRNPRSATDYAYAINTNWTNQLEAEYRSVNKTNVTIVGPKNLPFLIIHRFISGYVLVHLPNNRWSCTSYIHTDSYSWYEMLQQQKIGKVNMPSPPCRKIYQF